jgi:RHS repeat-associated protein
MRRKRATNKKTGETPYNAKFEACLPPARNPYIQSTNVWFNGRNVAYHNPYSGYSVASDSTYYQDRLGSDRSGGARYYPYGEEITSTSNDRVKFGTYIRDSATALDYADQRYYASSYGRFNTADQYMASAGPGDPGSWNRYRYASGDPVNRIDPSGRDDCNVADPSCEEGCDQSDPSCLGDSNSFSGTTGGPSVSCSGPFAAFGQLGCGCLYAAMALNEVTGSCAAFDADQGEGGGDGTSCSGVLGTSGACYIGLHKSGKDWNSFNSIVKRLYKELRSDTKCDDFLEGFGGSLTTLLKTSVATEYTLATNIEIPVPGLGLGSYGDLPGGTPNGAPIAINWSAFANQVNIGNQLQIILHEMAHALGAPPDGFGTAATQQLNADIAQQCSKEVGQTK